MDGRTAPYRQRYCQFFVNSFCISIAQAYNDTGNVRVLVGNVKNPGKEFQRLRATNMVLEGYELAMSAKTQTDIKKAIAMIKAGEAIAKVHRLNIDEVAPPAWGNIIPLEIEPELNVSVISSKKIENLAELKTKHRKKYGAN